jgi:hypothetical protein
VRLLLRMLPLPGAREHVHALGRKLVALFVLWTLLSESRFPLD